MKVIADPVRAVVLWTLLDGRAYTATELAIATETSLQNMSMHLAKLLQAGLLKVERQGRHRYFRFSREEVAYAIEGLAALVPKATKEGVTAGVEQSAIRHCRTCYDHLAGLTGVSITESLIGKRYLSLSGDRIFLVTEKGQAFFRELNIDTAALGGKRRMLARPCLDWSERKYHLAGALGAALLDSMLKEHWVRRVREPRVIVVTAAGRKALYELLGVIA